MKSKKRFRYPTVFEVKLAALCLNQLMQDVSTTYGTILIARGFAVLLDMYAIDKESAQKVRKLAGRLITEAPRLRTKKARP